MVSDTPTEAGGSPGNQGADGGVRLPTVDGNREGLRDVGAVEPRKGVEGDNHQDNPGADGSAADRTAGERNDEAGPRDPAEAGGEVPPSERKPGNKRYTKTEIAIALREADGNVQLAAAALDCSTFNVRWWITNDSELNALWGGTSPKSEPVVEPGEDELMNRSPENAPAAIPSPAAVNLALGISEMDATILLKGLKGLGISDKTLERLRKLDDLAQSNGHFLSVSLQTTHRMYFVQLVEMMEMAQKMKTDFIDFEEVDPKDSTKKVVRLSIEERAWFYKCYTEMVKEAGKGYNTMVEGTKSLVLMLKAASQDGDKPTNGKPKWHQRTTKSPKKKT